MNLFRMLDLRYVFVEGEAIILIFGVIFAVVLMMFSRMWKRRMFSIFAVGVWLFMAFQLTERLPLLIVCMFLVIEELWYALIARVEN